MADTNLRATVIRLASRRADLRPHLLPLLAPPTAAPVPQAPAYYPTSAPIVVQPSPPPPPPPAQAPIIVQPPPPPPAPPPPAPIIVMPGMMPQYPMAPVPAPAPAPAAQVTVAPQVTVNPTVPAQPTFTAPPPTAVMDRGHEVFVTSRTQEGFDSDLAPEMTRMLQLGMTKEQVADWGKLRVREAFRTKDSLYMILIRYQSTFENDEQFRLSLERAIDIWRVTGATAASPEV